MWSPENDMKENKMDNTWHFFITQIFKSILRSSRSEMFLEKGVLKICRKFTGEHPCRSVISIKLQSNFIEITLQHGCSPVNLLHIFRIPFTKNTSGWLLLYPPYFPGKLHSKLPSYLFKKKGLKLWGLSNDYA